jgi:hypothetical protein
MHSVTGTTMRKLISQRLAIAVAVLPCAVLLSGCPDCADPCSLELGLPLSPTAAVSVEFAPPAPTQATHQCSWGVPASGGAGAWTCDPPPLYPTTMTSTGDGSHWLVMDVDGNTRYNQPPWQITVTGPTGSTDVAVSPQLWSSSEGCNCVGTVRVPADALASVGAPVQ